MASAGCQEAPGEEEGGIDKPGAEVEEQEQAAVTLPDCAATCGVNKSCSAGCSELRSGSRVATTCEQYMSGNCEGKGEVQPPGEGGGGPPPSGGGGPDWCPRSRCREEGARLHVGSAIRRKWVVVKGGRPPHWENQNYKIYAQQAWTYRSAGGARCLQERCCDVIYAERVVNPVNNWGYQGADGVCRRF